jgi:GR25 family glycosyltransferase involved in LPS biosynthesis
MTQGALKIYAINLNRSTARRRFIEEQQSLTGQVEFIAAEDKLERDPEQLRHLLTDELKAMPEYMTSGLICCTLSHMKARHAVAEWGAGSALIIEDDAKFITKRPALTALRNFLDISDYDILLLNSYSNRRIVLNRSQSKDVAGFTLYDLTNDAPGSGLAYLVKAAAARRMIDLNREKIVAASDSWVTYAGIGLRIGIVKPDLFEPAFFPSDLGYVREGSAAAVLKLVVPDWLRAMRARRAYRKMLRNLEFSTGVSKVSLGSVGN